MRGRIIFTGGFWEYFAISLALMILTVLTLGLLAPYLIYWHFAYFFKNMEIEFYERPGDTRRPFRG